MAFDLEKYRLEQEDIANNTSNRVPICFLVDTSMSMKLEKRMEKVNTGISEFIKTMKEDMYAASSVVISVVTFGGNNAEMKIPFTEIRKVNFDYLLPNGHTPLGEGAKMAINAVDAQLEKYNNMGITTYHPWIIIFSDGKATDISSYKRYAKEMCRRQKEEHWKVMCVALGDEENSLAEFSLKKTVCNLKDVDISDFFEWISQSVSSVSKSRPDLINLDEEYNKFKDQLI